ncbi:MAG TPA: hypothetical protein VK985_08885 [Rariglobus sp.]|nr:hypothetical protein [Rariglobus sp.]
MKTSLFARLLCLGLLCSVPLLQADTLTYQDTFNHKAEEAGSPLDSRSVGNSKAIWEATANAVLVKGGGIRASDDNPFVGRVELPGTFKDVTVEADIYPAGKGWMSVGIGSGALGNPNFGGLFLMVTTGGNFSLMFNPDPDDTRSSKVVALKAGRIRGWKPDTMNTIKLVYNQEADTVSAFANGDEKIVKDISLKEKSYVLRAEYAGVSGIFQSSDDKSVAKVSVIVQK